MLMERGRMPSAVYDPTKETEKQATSKNRTLPGR